MTLTQNLVQLVRNRDITHQDRQASALFLLDALASAYAGSNTPVGRKLIAWAKREPLNASTKAFLMGSLAHITETDDLHKASVTHPGCVVVPGILAMANRADATGQDLLDATLQGFEVMCRIGRAVGSEHYKKWHNTATCGPFGSAMAVGSLLKLSDKQCVNALGNAGTQSSGLWQFLQSGAMSKHLHAGRASESGLLAAELAEHDFTGAADILEGDQGVFKAMCPDAIPGEILNHPDAVWELLQTSIKPWPSCRHTHPAIDAALSLRSQIGNSIIDQVHINSYQAALDVCDRPSCENEYQAKFSLQHCVATALQTGIVSLESFSAEARDNVSELAKQCYVGLSEKLDQRYPQAWGASVAIRCVDGREVTAVSSDCKGDPELPLTEIEMIEKSTNLLLHAGLTVAAASALVAQVKALPESTVAVEFMDSYFTHILAQ